MKKILVWILTLAVVLSTPCLNVYAATEGPDEGATVEQAEEVAAPEVAAEEVTAVPEVVVEEVTAAPETIAEAEPAVPETIAEEEKVSEAETAPAKEEIKEQETFTEEPSSEKVEEPEIIYPAQVLKVTAADGAKIIVTAPEGAFPAGSYVTATLVPEAYVLPLLDGAEHAAAYDITVFNADGKEVQPKKAVSVRMENTGLEDADSVYYVNDAMTKATLVTDAIENPDDAFMTDHFTIYVIDSISDFVTDYNGVPYRSSGQMSTTNVNGQTITLHVGDTYQITNDSSGTSANQYNQSKLNEWNNSWHIWDDGKDIRDGSGGLEVESGGYRDNTIYASDFQPYLIITVKAPPKGSEYWIQYYSGSYASTTPPNVHIKVVKQYDVTFNANGHGTAPETQKVDDGQTATKPADPTADGYTFMGWYEKEDCTGAAFDFETPITADKTLYAKWAKSCTVTFKNYDGTVLSEKVYGEGTPASDIAVPDAPTKPEDKDYVYTFDGWNPALADVTGDVTYTAQFTSIKKIHIHYDLNLLHSDNIDPPEDTIATPGTTVKLRANAGGSAFFKQWNTKADGTGTGYGNGSYQAEYTMGSEDITLYAQWKYIIIFSKNGDGVENIPADLVLNVGSSEVSGTLPKQEPTRENYKFIGWATSKEHADLKIVDYRPGDPISFKPSDFKTYLDAVWTSPDEYAITYNLDGGKLEEGETNPTTYNVFTPSFTLYNPVKEGYKFMGWTGTNLTEPSKTVTIEKGSTGKREYKATWKKLLDYKLEVTPVKAGDSIIAATVKEADGKSDKTSASAGWVDSTEELEKYKACWAGTSDNWDSVQTVKGTFEQGKTYYAFAALKFEEDEVPDIERVSLVETDMIKPAGDAFVRSNGREVMIPFSVTIPFEEYAITYNMDGGSLEEGRTNPDKYTVATESFTLNNPVKKGYKFQGWTGTGLEEASKTVTIAKGSTGPRTYTATWEKLEDYFLDVTQIHAGVKASYAAVKEHDGKISIGTAPWVTSQSDVDAFKAYYAGQSSSFPASFTDYFQAGETYYSVAIVTFANDEEPDVSRVTLNETEYIKAAGDPVVNESENEVIVPFSVTIPAITVTVDFGSKHETLAAQVAAAATNGITMKALEGTLTYKAEKGSDRWYDVTAPLREAMYDAGIDWSKPDNGEKLYMGYIAYNLKPIDSYNNAEECAEDMEIVMGQEPQNADLQLYILWTKPTEVGLTITKPACGTKVTADASKQQQDPRPVITVTSGNAEVYKISDEDGTYDPTYWINNAGDNLFTGTMEGGNTYRAMTVLMPGFGYYVDPAKITVTNGTLVEQGENQRPDAPIFIDVEVEHDWGDWKETKAPTETEEGEETRVCNGDATHTDTRPIPKTGHVHDEKLTKVTGWPATCTERGQKDYYKCSGCSAIFEDENAQTQTSSEGIVIPMKGHKSGEPVIDEASRKEASCSSVGGYNVITRCADCGAVLRTERVVIPFDPDAHDWGEWVVTKEATEDEDGLEVRTCKNDSEHTEERVIPKVDPNTIIYRSISGDGSSWTEGSSDPLTFIFKRSLNDDRTFSHFTGIQVDGKDVAETNYTAESGSVIIKLKPEYLKTLAVGEHTLTTLFNDGNKSVNAVFTIKAQANGQDDSKQSPSDNKQTPSGSDKAPTGNDKAPSGNEGVKTGDENNMVLWSILLASALVTIVGFLVNRKRKER